MAIERTGNKYTQQQRLQALEIFHQCGRNYELAEQESGVAKRTMLTWTTSDWGKVKLAELAIKDNSAAINTGLQTIIDTKIDHINTQFKFFTDLEDLMNQCIIKYNNLIPNATKLAEVNETFKILAETYLKAMAITTGKDDKIDDGSARRTTIINLIEKQMTKSPFPVREILEDNST